MPRALAGWRVAPCCRRHTSGQPGCSAAADAPAGSERCAMSRRVGTATTTSADVADRAAALGDAAFAAAWAEGRAMTLEQAVAYALEEQPSA